MAGHLPARQAEAQCALAISTRRCWNWPGLTCVLLFTCHLAWAGPDCPGMLGYLGELIVVTPLPTTTEEVTVVSVLSGQESSLCSHLVSGLTSGKEMLK